MGAASGRLNVRAVGFDFDHTLGIDNKLERVVFLRLLEDACAGGGRCLGTLAEEIERIDELLVQQRAGAFTIDDAVERFVRERGADPAGYAQRYKAMAVAMLEEFVIPEPGVSAMLGNLRKRNIPYAILTNGWSPLQQHKAKRVGFDGAVLVSSQIGTQKPELRAFEALARALATPAHEIAFVGDSPAIDITGAHNAGMRTVWFDAEGVAYPKEIPAPAAVIHSLAELAALT